MNKDIALYIAQILDEKKTEDIEIIDISEKSGFADFFVIATAKNMRHLSAVSTELEDKLAENNILIHHTEGQNDSGWILQDYGDIIVNLFTAEERNHYQLERVWNDCLRVEFEPKKEG